MRYTLYKYRGHIQIILLDTKKKVVWLSDAFGRELSLVQRYHAEAQKKSKRHPRFDG